MLAASGWRPLDVGNPPPQVDEDAQAALPMPARTPHFGKRKPQPQEAPERLAVQAARATRDELYAVALEVATRWHTPWRLWHSWPKRLEAVALSWMRGDLGAARRRGQVRCCDLLQAVAYVQTPSQQHIAAFLLLLGKSFLHAVPRADRLEGAEVAVALEAVGAYITLQQTTHARAFEPKTMQRLTALSNALTAGARQMRNEAP